MMTFKSSGRGKRTFFPGRRPFSIALVPMVASCLFADGVGGLPDFSNLSLQELSEVKVTSVSKKEQKLSQVAAAVYVISQEEIRRSGMTTVADLLRIVPGVTVARIDSSKWAVTSRGFNGRFASNLLVLIDGRSVYSPIFGGVYWDMNMPLLDDINRIEVIRGPGASIWGANAMTGVINIITKSAKEVKGTFVSAGGGTAERAFGQVRFGGSVTDGISYRTYLSAFDRSPFQISNGHDGTDSWSGEQGGFRIEGTTKTGGWHLETDFYRNRRAEEGVGPTGTGPISSKDDFMGTSANVAFEWHRQVTENSDLRINTYYDFVSRPEIAVPVAETRTGDFELQYHIAAPKGHDISIGLGDRLIFAEGPSTGDIRMNPSQLTYQVPSGFVQDELHFAKDRLLVTVGAKLEHDFFTGWQLDPTARVLWSPNKRHSAWAAVSRASRQPTFFERDLNAVVGTQAPSASTFGLPLVIALVNSPQYQSEILTAYEIGYRAQVSPRFSIDIAGFYDENTRLKTENPGQAGLISGSQPYLLVPITYTNNLNAAAVGGEISAAYHPFSRWKLAGSYSHLDVHEHLSDTAPPGTVNSSPNVTPRNSWRVQSFLNLSKSVQFDTLLFSSSAVLSPIYPFGESVVPPHTRLDVRLGWRVSSRVEISVSAQDLLEARHYEMPGYEDAYVPRGYYLKTTWRF